MISKCHKCIKQMNSCGTKLSEIKMVGDSLPIVVTHCINFEKRVEEHHKCSDCKFADQIDCGASLRDVKIAGRRIFVCDKYEKEEVNL